MNVCIFFTPELPDGIIERSAYTPIYSDGVCTKKCMSDVSDERGAWWKGRCVEEPPLGDLKLNSNNCYTEIQHDYYRRFTHAVYGLIDVFARSGCRGDNLICVV